MEITKTELQDSKINPEDVWKEFNCPKYVTHLCFKTEKLPKEVFDFDRQLKLDTHRILQKLDELISDPVTRDTSVLRICRLLFDFLNEVGDDGYKIKDLPLIIKVLKFLAENVKTVEEYKLHLNRMLELCNIPPLLEKSSDSLILDDIMEQYFTLLGHLLIILPTEHQILKIHRILHSLLLKTEIKNSAAVKFEHCRKAMEKSKLPIIIAELLRTSYLKMYEKILQLVFLLSSISYESCYKMLEANILNTILIRMDLPFATQIHCKHPPDMLLKGNEYSDETILLIMNILWSLMKSLTFSNEKLINLKKNLIPTHCALWGLCYTFKRQIYYSKYRYFNTKVRNEIAMIILMISINLPSWNLVGSGIADIIIEILIGIETNSVRIFSEIITFGTSIEDLYLEKIILLIIINLAEVNACLIEKEKLMQIILQIINPNIKKKKIKWNPSQFWDIWIYAINALSILVPKMSKQFVDYNGGIRLCMILEWCLDIKFDIKIVMITIKTICIIILNNDKYILEYFRQCGYVFLLIKLIQYILKFDKIRMIEQRILTLTLLSIEKLIKKQIFYQKIYGEYSVTLSMELLFRCLYQKDQEFKLDQRLLLAIGSYIWECIVWCPENLEKFIDYGGIYIILDIIEIVPYCSHCLFLALFTDICDNFFCGPFICTWRGINKEKGLMSLLAKIWREEEIRIKIKKNVNDEELIHINQKQFDAYFTKLIKDSSPAIIDMIGSVRSKIYSIYKIIERDNERYLMAKEHYKILNNNLSLEDKITMSTINMYFALKLGQVWVEIAKFFEQSGITPLGMDGQAIFLITQRYYMWTEMTKERQMRILQSIDKQKDMEEKDEYARIRNSKLIIALNALDELDYIYRTTKRSNMLKKKHEQIKQVNLALKFPEDSDDAHCHRTFQDKIMVTDIFNQHQIISSGLKLNTNLSQMKLKLIPISPYDSYISDKTYSEFSSSSSTYFSNIKKFKEDE